MKRTLAFLMAVCMLLSAAALGEAASGFPLTEEKITLTVLTTPKAQETDLKTNVMALEYEKMTGVHVEWIVTEDFNTDLNLYMAGGNYPDIILGGLNTTAITMMAEAKMALPLNEMIENGTVPNYAAFLESAPDVASQLVAPDGNIYTFVITDVGDHNKSTFRMYVNTAWMNAYMEATGNGKPVTIDEYEEMLTYFRDNDMNGNGIADDEIPFITSASGYCANPIYYLMNAFTFTSENFYHISDGEVVFEANNDAWREGLKWVNHLYTEGLFDAETTFVQDNTQLKALVSRPENEMLVGSVTHFWQGQFCDTTVLPWMSFECLSPLTGPEGFAQATTTYQTALVSPTAAITTACEYPEIAARWIDWWLSEEGSFLHTYGMREGVDYEWVDEVNFLGTKPALRIINKENNYRFGNGNLPILDSEYIRYCVADTEEGRYTSNVYVLLQGIRAQQPYWVYNGIPQINWCEDKDLIAEVAEYTTLFSDYVKTSFSEFVLGIRDINDDAQWNEYLSTLESMNLNEYLELLTEYYSL